MKKPVKRKPKLMLAAAIRLLAEEQARHRHAVGMAELRLGKLSDVLACISNELAAASAAHVAEMTALRQQIAGLKIAASRRTTGDISPLTRRAGNEP